MCSKADYNQELQESIFRIAYSFFYSLCSSLVSLVSKLNEDSWRSRAGFHCASPRPGRTVGSCGDTHKPIRRKTRACVVLCLQSTFTRLLYFDLLRMTGETEAATPMVAPDRPVLGRSQARIQDS